MWRCMVLLIRPNFDHAVTGTIVESCHQIYCSPCTSCSEQSCAGVGQEKASQSAQECPCSGLSGYASVCSQGWNKGVGAETISKPEDRNLTREVECRFPMSTELPCGSVKAYALDWFGCFFFSFCNFFFRICANEACWASEDELDLGLAENLNERYEAS
jgi:hypothetical protein